MGTTNAFMSGEMSGGAWDAWSIRSDTRVVGVGCAGTCGITAIEATGPTNTSSTAIDATGPTNTSEAGAAWENIENKQRARKKGARWGRIAVAIAGYRWIYRRRRQPEHRRDRWGDLRTGGGVSKDAHIRNEGLRRHTLDGRPVALARWATWKGQNATEIQHDIAHRLVGGMVSESTKQVYGGLFKKWTAHRRALGKPPLLTDDPNDADTNEAAVIAYVVLNLGPLERDVGTVQNHLQAIGYHHKIHYGDNPLRSMTRLQF